MRAMEPSSETLLSRDESSSIKGILMLLIVLGHDIPFVDWTDSWMVMVWLYLFHIHSFFLLPFLYPIKPLDFYRFWNHIIRYYIKFICFALPLLTINQLEYLFFFIVAKKATTLNGLKLRIICITLST